MRSRLITTVALTVAMVLIALLVPIGVLVQRYAQQDRLTRSALEVQATETVVATGTEGDVSVFLTRANRDADGVSTTVYYADGAPIGPGGPEPAEVAEARESGRARVEDIDGGVRIITPTTVIGSEATTPTTATTTAVVVVDVLDSAYRGGVYRAWALLALLGLALLVAAVLVADRLSRSFVRPILELADAAGRLGTGDLSTEVRPSGPREVRQVGVALNRLTGRVGELIDRERENVASLSHRLRTPVTALRLDVDAVGDDEVRGRLSDDVDALEITVDAVIREARRSQREGLAAVTDATAAVRRRTQFWAALAEDQGRPFTVRVPDVELPVRTSADDLDALVDVLVDNVFSHTDEGVALAVSLTAVEAGGAVLVVEDAGRGLPAGDPTERGTSHAGSTGLGLDIARRTAEVSGGRLGLGTSVLGGTRIDVHLGAPA